MQQKIDNIVPHIEVLYNLTDMIWNSRMTQPTYWNLMNNLSQYVTETENLFKHYGTNRLDRKQLFEFLTLYTNMVA